MAEQTGQPAPKDEQLPKIHPIYKKKGKVYVGYIHIENIRFKFSFQQYTLLLEKINLSK